MPPVFFVEMENLQGIVLKIIDHLTKNEQKQLTLIVVHNEHYLTRFNYIIIIQTQMIIQNVKTAVLWANG